MAEVRRAIGVPLMADESVRTPRDAMEVIRRGAADVVNVYVTEAGGLLRASQIFALCEAAGLPCMIGSMPEFGIGTAADLLGVAPQSLRAYEARGLLEPSRTDGGTRRYSHDDLDRVRRISELLAAGLNLAGVTMVLELESRNDTLTRELAQRTGRSSHR